MNRHIRKYALASTNAPLFRMQTAHAALILLFLDVRMPNPLGAGLGPNKTNANSGDDHSAKQAVADSCYGSFPIDNGDQHERPADLDRVRSNRRPACTLAGRRALCPWLSADHSRGNRRGRCGRPRLWLRPWASTALVRQCLGRLDLSNPGSDCGSPHLHALATWVLGRSLVLAALVVVPKRGKSCVSYWAAW